MNNKVPNVADVWKQLEDLLVPRLGLSVTDRAVYSHLIRHTRLEGKSRLRFSIPWLARGVRLTGGPVRDSVRRLVANGALRLIERSKAGHVVEALLPEEIRGAFARSAQTDEWRSAALQQRVSAGPESIEKLDFFREGRLRKAIHARERGQCFYCLRRIAGRMQCLDHVLPRAQMVVNSYRNLVSCCVECNSRKGEKAAKDFLRGLYREQRLSTSEFENRLRALEALAKGKLRPALATPAKSPIEMGPPTLRHEYDPRRERVNAGKKKVWKYSNP